MTKVGGRELPRITLIRSVRAALACAAVLGGAFSYSPRVRAESRSPIPPNIRIPGDPAFVREVVSALQRLEGSLAGGRVLRRLEASGRSISIRAGILDRSGGVLMRLAGGDSIIVWNPDFSLPDFPARLVLHHELVHALYWTREDALPAAEEEERAIGLGRFAASQISENAVRREWGLPPRTEYTDRTSWIKTRGRRGDHGSEGE